MTDFRQRFLPYVVQPGLRGGFNVLNREYIPLGHDSCNRSTATDIAFQAAAVTFKRLTLSDVLKISVDPASVVGGPMYLYDDGCVPTRSKANWAAYSARLAHLATLVVASVTQGEYDATVAAKRAMLKAKVSAMPTPLPGYPQFSFDPPGETTDMYQGLMDALADVGLADDPTLPTRAEFDAVGARIDKLLNTPPDKGALQ